MQSKFPHNSTYQINHNAGVNNFNNLLLVVFAKFRIDLILDYD